MIGKSSTLIAVVSLSVASMLLATTADAVAAGRRQDRCRLGLVKATSRFVRSSSRARQNCMASVLRGDSSLLTDCVGGDGDGTTQTRVIRATARLSSVLSRRCFGADLLGLGFPGSCRVCSGDNPSACQDDSDCVEPGSTCLSFAEGTSFDANDLELCVMDKLDDTISSTLKKQYPSPAATLAGASFECVNSVGRKATAMLTKAVRARQKCHLRNPAGQGGLSTDCREGIPPYGIGTGDSRTDDNIEIAYIRLLAGIPAVCGKVDVADLGFDDDCADITPRSRFNIFDLKVCQFESHRGEIVDVMETSFPREPECGNGIREFGEGCDDDNDIDTDACLNTCEMATCGDKVVWEGEEGCDDGNASDTDGCLADCTPASCGDGKVWAEVEDCDDQNLSNNDACLNDCVAASCGDGHTYIGVEDCDDGNNISGDACDAECKIEFCGDGVTQIGLGEECDNGVENSNSQPDACRQNCSLPSCGDGVADTGEGCDDGNAANGDGCSIDCQVEAVCGDGVAEFEEECDDGGESATCDDDCTAAQCGDGKLNLTAGEDCDGDGSGNGGETATCDADCSTVECGDGTHNAAAGEECDDGGESADCNPDCSNSRCGDGIRNESAGEFCDDGGETATCDVDCSPVECGDGTPNAAAGEECDDAGESADCNPDCTTSRCGDAITNGSAGEFCDDGGETATCDVDCSPVECGDGTHNAAAGEDCDDGGESADCNPDCTTTRCGDGIFNLAAGEACDDGNLVDGDGCDSNCTATACGNGIVTAGEDCDGDGAGNGGETAACDLDCSTAECGDGTHNAAAGESCDDAGQSASCDGDCSEVLCGDGTLNTAAGEQCDDGNEVGGDCCSPTCTSEPGCQHAQCPDRGELTLFAGVGRSCTDDIDCPVGTCDPLLGRCRTVTELDTGTTGISHDADINDNVLTKGRLLCGGPPPCGECTVEGIDPEPGNCRCSNDTRQVCDQPFEADEDDCGGSVCDCYFGAPFPLSSGGIGACVLNRFADDISGTANVDIGSGKITANLKTKVFLAINNFVPCPTCVGDATFGDGVRDGTCVNGESDGLSCDASGENSTFPSVLEDKVCDGDLATPCQVDSDCKWCSGDGQTSCNLDADCSIKRCSGDGQTTCNLDADCDPPGPGGTCVAPGGTCSGPGGNCLLVVKSPSGGFYSLDCLPEVGANISGAGLQIGLTQTTGTSSLPTASRVCGFPFIGVSCHCRQCSGDTTVPCSSDAECAEAGLGTCSSLGSGTNQGPNGCQGGACVAIEGGEAECQGAGAPPPERFCDGVVRGDGQGYIACSDDTECAPSATGMAGAGFCTQSRTKECFLPDITATGVADPHTPVGVATFCIPPTSSGGINGVVGLPGPGRVTNQAAARTFCAGDPNVEYQPGVGGCP